ncbi:MAG: AAA family ATPase [Planctomycetia bacterium]|nr:MAG: AAA family ATPase [Planctomycetia bacterium]RIK69619.1 MAG: chromosome partitioning protein ParA [Planctomycetota bacterium]
MECIAVINQKGGVGKTTTAVNLGAALGQRGKRVLMLDLDPQGHLTTHLGLDEVAPGRGIYEVLTRDLPLEKAFHPYGDHLTVVPAQIDLAAAEVELVSVVGREVILRDILAAQERPFDLAIIDCPPSLGILTLNALSASTRVLIPLQAHFLALQGAGKLFETISLVSQRINPILRVMGIVLCMYEAGTKLSAEVVADLQGFLDSSRASHTPWRDARIFESRIRRNVKLAECPSHGQSIFEYAEKSNGAIDYLALADEFLATLVPVAPAAPTSPVEASAPTIPVSAGIPEPPSTRSRATKATAPSDAQPTEPAAEAGNESPAEAVARVS